MPDTLKRVKGDLRAIEPPDQPPEDDIEEPSLEEQHEQADEAAAFADLYREMDNH